MEEKYFDALMESLEDPAAFAQGDTSRAILQTKAVIASHTMRKRAAESGFMADAEIEAEISATRAGNSDAALMTVSAFAK